MSAFFHAYAKVNLYLHITGRREDGYHFLDSMVVPVKGIFDRISIVPSDGLSLTVQGPFASRIDHEPADGNLVVRAAVALAAHLGRRADIKITLEKNIPPGAGLGGGSADAAATLRGLLDLWGASIDPLALQELMTTLGSDVAACYADTAVIMRGIGERLIPAPALPPLPLILIYPGVPSSTPITYRNYKPPFSAAVTPPGVFHDTESVMTFLSRQRNDLTESAIQSVPDIQNVLDILALQPDLRLCRMTGSGSACFGIFGSDKTAQDAQLAISRSAPSSWWVRRGVLSSPR